MKSAKVRFFRASSAACRDCVAAGCDDEALVWEGSVYVEEMGYAKFAVGFDMTVLVVEQMQADLSDFFGV